MCCSFIIHMPEDLFLLMNCMYNYIIFNKVNTIFIKIKITLSFN